MKILAIGDFHGKFPENLRKKAKEVDLIISVGDFPDSSELRDAEFKHWKELKKKSLSKIIGKKKYISLLKKQSSSQEKILKILSSFKKPVFVIYGNADMTNKEAKKFSSEGLETQCEKFGITLLKKDFSKIDNFVIAGFPGYRGAGSKGLTKMSIWNSLRVIYYNFKWNRKLNSFGNELKNFSNVLFVAHDVPYGYFDLIKNKSSPLNNHRIGDKYFTGFIKKFQPELFLCGHMHEYHGIKKLGKTRIVQVGAALDKKGAIINLDKNGKVGKIQLIK